MSYQKKETILFYFCSLTRTQDEALEDKEAVQNIQAAAGKAHEAALQIVEAPDASSADVNNSAQPEDRTLQLIEETSTVFGCIQQRQTAFWGRSIQN